MQLSPKEIEPDERFAGLGMALRRTFTTNYTPGQPLTRGQILVNTRLYRIATDGKIFSHREKRKSQGRDFEIGILVDISGSMSGAKVKEAMKVGAAAWLSLRSARIPTFLLAHTSLGYGNDIPVVYIIAKGKDNPSHVLRRANAPLQGHVSLRNNYDSFALQEALKFFSNKRTKKWLFHVSDGQPAGSSYGGPDAIAHCQAIVGGARRRGIDVVSITIDRGAYKINDRIYGEEKNIKTTSTKVLAELISAMFITKRRSS